MYSYVQTNFYIFQTYPFIFKLSVKFSYDFCYTFHFSLGNWLMWLSKIYCRKLLWYLSDFTFCIQALSLKASVDFFHTFHIATLMNTFSGSHINIMRLSCWSCLPSLQVQTSCLQIYTPLITTIARQPNWPHIYHKRPRNFAPQQLMTKWGAPYPVSLPCIPALWSTPFRTTKILIKATLLAGRVIAATSLPC